MKVRWWQLLSVWILVLSILLPAVSGPSTFPLNVLATVGCVDAVRYLGRADTWHYCAWCLGMHLAPFLWVPPDLSPRALSFAVGVVALYVCTLELAMGVSVVGVYTSLLRENHAGGWRGFRRCVRTRLGYG